MCFVVLASSVASDIGYDTILTILDSHHPIPVIYCIFRDLLVQQPISFHHHPMTQLTALLNIFIAAAVVAAHIVVVHGAAWVPPSASTRFALTATPATAATTNDVTYARLNVANNYPYLSSTSYTTAINLFGSGAGSGKSNSGEKKQPGMMDQLAMLKKAQEMAQKKQKIDEELKKMTFQGSSSNGKVIVTMSFVPTNNPMDPNPDYEATNFTFDETFYAESTPEQIAEACKEAWADGIANTNVVIAEKYNVLSGDLLAALGQK
jgi:hypothetical protein